jgi:hypothetical protein
VQFDKRFHQRQSNAQTADRTLQRRIRLRKHFENTRNLIRGNTDAVIPYPDNSPIAFSLQGKRNGARLAGINIDKADLDVLRALYNAAATERRGANSDGNCTISGQESGIHLKTDRLKYKTDKGWSPIAPGRVELPTSGLGSRRTPQPSESIG